MDDGWLKTNEPQVILFQGMRGSGKGVAVDKTAEELYHQGINIWHIWGARSFENLYWAINKNCKVHYDKIKIVADAFFDDVNGGTLIQKGAAKGLNEKEFRKYVELMIQQKLIDRKSEHVISITNLGVQLHKRELLHCNCHNSYPII